jgi:hypothetical protein
VTLLTGYLMVKVLDASVDARDAEAEAEVAGGREKRA